MGPGITKLLVTMGLFVQYVEEEEEEEDEEDEKPAQHEQVADEEEEEEEDKVTAGSLHRPGLSAQLVVEDCI